MKSESDTDASRVLGLVPARGGSKGVPRKNIRLLAGKPLITWTLERALACERIDRVLVSTDDEEIAEIALESGAEVPFLRPAEYARDDTPDMPVYRHALDWLAKNDGYVPDAVVWLRPTTPLRTVEDMLRALDILEQSSADCVRSVCEVEHHPYWMKRIHNNSLLPFEDGKDEKSHPRRQMLPPVYRLTGVVDVVRHQEIERGTLFCGEMRPYVMPQDRSVDIDTELDFRLAEILRSVST